MIPARLHSGTLCALAALWGGCGHGGEPQDAGPARVVVAHLEFIKGSVTLEHDGKEGPAQLGYVYAHDALETGADGDARLRLPGDRTVQMGPDSRFVVEEDATGLVIQVPRGTILSQSSEGTAAGVRALSIQTPFGRTQLGTGNNGVSLVVGKDGAKVDVLMGQVELLGNDGKQQEVSKGDRVELTMGKVERVQDEKKGPPGVSELPPLQITVTEAGAAEIRKKGTRRWTALKRGDALAVGDSLKVRQGRASVLKVADNALTVPAGSEVTLQGAARDGAVETSTLELAKGALALTLASGRRSRVNLGGLQLESPNGGQFTVARTAEGYDVAALAGDLTAKKDGVEQPVMAGQVTRMGKRGNEVRPTGVSDVLLPSRGGTRVFHAGSIGEVTLSWPGEKRDYVVEVAYDSEFKERVVAGLVHQPLITVQAPRQSSLYWRVFEPDGKTALDRGSAVFRPEFTADAASTFHDTVQEGSDKTTIYYQNALPAVTLTYRTQADAAKYELKVFKANALTTPVIDRTSDADRISLEAGTLSEGSYLWSVTPLSAAGEELRGGKMTKLDLVYDNAVPSLTVRSPRNADVLNGGKVQATGVAPVGSKVLINSKPASLDDKGRFDEPVTPTGRPPVVVFRLVRPGSFDVVVVRTLRKGAR